MKVADLISSNFGSHTALRRKSWGNVSDKLRRVKHQIRRAVLMTPACVMHTGNGGLLGPLEAI